MKDPEFKIRPQTRGAIAIGVVLMIATSIAPTRLTAQRLSAPTPETDRPGNYWTKMAIGFGLSLLAHESAHILSSLAMGFHPSVGLEQGRPTVFSGIDSQKYPHNQFIFSASGLTTQAVIDELILDLPHTRGSAIERGILAGGIGTTLFYITIGRNGSVSDIAFMARTSNLSKTQVSLIFGAVNAIHALRISRDPAYDHFFVAPADNGFAVGLRF